MPRKEIQKFSPLYLWSTIGRGNHHIREISFHTCLVEEERINNFEENFHEFWNNKPK
jgi:hypothetical protein